MEWIIKIENQPKLRIKVSYLSEEDKVLFKGQYKYREYQWVDMNSKITSNNLNTDDILESLYEVSSLLKQRVVHYSEFAEAFNSIKVIEINDNTNQNQ